MKFDVAFVNFILYFSLISIFLECKIFSDFLDDSVVFLALFFESFDFRGEPDNFSFRTVELRIYIFFEIII